MPNTGSLQDLTSQTEMYRRATNQRKNAPRDAIYQKKTFVGHNLPEKFLN